MPDLKRRIIEIAIKNKQSHAGSALSSVDIIERIYREKKKEDIFILSCGHAFLALAVVLEVYEGKNAEELVKKHGIHATRDEDNGIWCSTGSLGNGIGIALGTAIAQPNKKIYCLVSDGETCEGAFWEVLRIASELDIRNLFIKVSCNGFGGMQAINIHQLKKQINGFGFNGIEVIKTSNYPLPETLDAHYLIPDEKIFF